MCCCILFKQLHSAPWIALTPSHRLHSQLAMMVPVYPLPSLTGHLVVEPVCRGLNMMEFEILVENMNEVDN